MNDAHRLAQLGALLETALALPPEDRRGALEATAPELAAEALALLEGEDELGDFLAAPAGQALGLTPDDEGGTESPARKTPEIPGFEIEELLGEGGMGSVWLARQAEPVARRVAVKMIRTHLPGLESPEAARGFAAEQRALARLNHPAIAQLYDARTTPEGRPYVVMEHVDGLSVTHYADRHRLSVDARLRLFVRICRGVEHAHRRALLHRDLKPSNLLVTEIDGEPAPKIIDFGIATALDSPVDPPSPLTTSRAGTPHYVSPEARSGSDDLDTRTDVYSLGVVLHELLVGCRPEAGERPSQTFAGLAAGRRSEVAAARSLGAGELGKRLRGDLDWIVLTALAPDRDDRYGSAAALADDVERSLTHRPVTARPPGWIDRTTKLVRRNPLAAGLSVLATTALAFAAVAVSVALVRATASERLARQEAAASAESLSFLIDLFEAARPEESRGRTLSADELVAAGVERIEAADDLAPLQRARLLHALADVQLRMADYDGGRTLALEALALREARLPSDDPAIAESLDLIGTLERRSGRIEEAAPWLERLVEVAEHRGDPEGLADALNSLANLRWRQDRLAEGEALHRRALDLRERLLAERPDDLELARDVAASVNNLGVLIWADGRDAEAEPYLRRAVRALENTSGPGHPRVADALGNLGIVVQNQGRSEESEALQRRSLAIQEEVLGPDHPATATALHNLGIALREQGELDEAETTIRRAVEIRRGALEPDHPDTLRTLRSLAVVLERQGRDDEAAEVRRQAADLDAE